MKRCAGFNVRLKQRTSRSMIHMRWSQGIFVHDYIEATKVWKDEQFATNLSGYLWHKAS